MGVAIQTYASSPPVVDALIPNHGTVAGGTGVQIVGSGFTGATAVAFGPNTLVHCGPGVFQSCFNVNFDGAIFANSPPGTVGPVDVRVTAGGVTSAANAYDKFTYDPAGPPVVSGLSPRVGSAAGGTGVQIFGSGFTGATQVTFGTAAVPPCAPSVFGRCFSVNADGEIFSNSPAGTVGPVDVKVSVGAVTSFAGTADAFTYVPPATPVVDVVVPGHGTAAGGTNIQILGSGFNGATQVTFGPATLVPCTPSVFGPCFNVNGDNGIFGNSPPGPPGMTVDVTVTAAGLTSATNPFAKFTFDPIGPPVVSGVSPHTGPATGGTSVQIAGSGFTGATQVAFGTTTEPPCTPSVFGPCFGVSGDNGILANSPPGSPGPPVDITVTVGAVTSGTSTADKFTYLAPGAPVVDAVVPGHGPVAGGTGLQIVGSGFTGATAVAFGATSMVPCGPTVFGPCFNVNGDNGIGANSPSGTVGPVNVRVTTSAGTSAINPYDTFTYDPLGPPLVSGLSPRSGPPTGGTNVTIVGSGFSGATAVVFGTTTMVPCPAPPPCFFPSGDSAIGANSPPGADGTTVHITVTNLVGTSPTSVADQFTYTSAPPPPLIVDAVSPNHGSTAGGIGVQIYGRGFSGATALLFGSTSFPPCVSGVFVPCFNVNGDSSIGTMSPPGTVGPVDVKVTVGGVTSAMHAFDTFTYDPAGPPVVGGASPRSGPTVGRTNVQIFGSGFSGATQVAFGTATLLPCSPSAFGPCFNVNGDNFISANSPPGAAGPPVNVTVAVGAVTSATGNADQFTYVAPGAPVVDAVVPGHGTAGGGTDVQILGSGFSGATQVAFGSATLASCNPSVFGLCFSVNGDNGIFTKSPPGTVGTIDVRVTNGAGTSAINVFDTFHYDPIGPPAVSGVSPHTGSATGGTGVQILGSGFTGATQVAFGTATESPCAPSVFQGCFTVNNDSGIFTSSPPGNVGPPVHITVTVGATTSAMSNADTYTYAAPGPPVVDVVLPGHGTAAGVTGVQIHGSGFSGASAVAFGTTILPPCQPSVFVPCFNVGGDNFIFANSPSGTLGPVNIRVTTAAGTSAINAFDTFTYDPIGPPVVSGVSPRSGPSTGGTGVLILGSGFTGTTAVAFGTGAPLPACPASGPCFHVNGDQLIFASSPPGTAGMTVDVRVTTPVDISAKTTLDQFTYTAPPIHTTLTETASLAHGGVPFTDTFIYRETNDGGDPISGVTVIGSICGPATYQSGDTNGNGVLDPGETWVFTCTHTFNAAGMFTDTATATGTDTTSNLPAPPETASATVQVGTGNAALGLGFWKNHTTATGALLPMTLGHFTVDSTTTASAIFAAMNCSNSSPQGAVGCLAAQLLTAELNVANDVSNACAYSTIVQANMFLVTIGYAGPNQTYPQTAAQREAAISLAGRLDSFNNGTCP